MTDFTRTRQAFHLPQGITYLDGNSLGPMPKAATDRVAHSVVEQVWVLYRMRGDQAECGVRRFNFRIERLSAAAMVTHRR